MEVARMYVVGEAEARLTRSQICLHRSGAWGGPTAVIDMTTMCLRGHPKEAKGPLINNTVKTKG